MVSVTTASRYITSASRHHPRYQSRSSIYVRGLIPLNFAELAEAVPIAYSHCKIRLLDNFEKDVDNTGKVLFHITMRVNAARGLVKHAKVNVL